MWKSRFANIQIWDILYSCEMIHLMFFKWHDVTFKILFAFPKSNFPLNILRIPASWDSIKWGKPLFWYLFSMYFMNACSMPGSRCYRDKWPAEAQFLLSLELVFQILVPPWPLSNCGILAGPLPLWVSFFIFLRVSIRINWDNICSQHGTWHVKKY